MKLPANIIGWLDGRSSLARLGLMVHVTAHRIDPGWEGKSCWNFIIQEITISITPKYGNWCVKF